MAKDPDPTIEVFTSILNRINLPEFSLKAVMETILDYVIEKTKADAGTILMKDEAQDALRIVALRGDKRSVEDKIPAYPANLGIQSIVFGTGKPRIVEDVDKADDYIRYWPHAMSEIAVPIQLSGKIVGVLTLDSRKRAHFNEADLELSSVLSAAAQAALKMKKLGDIEQVRRIERELLAKETCFVLMPFAQPFDKYYSAIIQPAIQDCGLASVRADELFGPGNLMREIWEGIKNARVLLAELTTRNPNVMYELGLAHAMEKPVVLLTQSASDLPFDVKAIRCVVYDTTDPDWAKKLSEAIGKHIEAIVRGKKRKRFRPF